MFETNEEDSSSVTLRLPPSPAGEGFFICKKEEAPREAGRIKLFLNTVHHIKKFDKTRILIKFLNTLIG